MSSLEEAQRLKVRRAHSHASVGLRRSPAVGWSAELGRRLVEVADSLSRRIPPGSPSFSESPWYRV